MSDQQKHTIFKTSNYMSLEDERFQLEDFAEQLREQGHTVELSPEYNDIHVTAPCGTCKIDYKQRFYDYLNDTIEINHQDTKRLIENMNLDYIFLIADSGTWRGRRDGSQCLPDPQELIGSFKCEDYHLYYDPKTGDVISELQHHDGTNFYTFREYEWVYYESEEEVPEEFRDVLQGELSMSPEQFETILYDTYLNRKRGRDAWLELIEKYTKPIGHHFARHYGWTIA